MYPPRARSSPRLRAADTPQFRSSPHHLDDRGHGRDCRQPLARIGSVVDHYDLVDRPARASSEASAARSRAGRSRVGTMTLTTPAAGMLRPLQVHRQVQPAG